MTDAPGVPAGTAFINFGPGWSDTNTAAVPRAARPGGGRPEGDEMAEGLPIDLDDFRRTLEGYAACADEALAYRDTLEAVAARLDALIAGPVGRPADRPWSPEYIRDEMRRLAGAVRDVLGDD